MNALVFDIGGARTRYAVFDGEGTILTRGSADTPQESREALIGFLTSVFEKEKDVEVISVSMPGIIDPEKGYCKMGGALRYNDDFYFRDALAERCIPRAEITVCRFREDASLIGAYHNLRERGAR